MHGLHSETLKIQNMVAVYPRNLERYEEAIPIFQRLVDQAQSSGDTDMGLAVLGNLANCQASCG